MVLVVGGAGERLAAALLRADVRPLARVRPDVHLADVGRRKRAVAALERTDERPLACARNTPGGRLRNWTDERAIACARNTPGG